MAVEIFYDDDADLSIIQGRKVAVIGYGSQGHAHALSLRDSGVDVRVGLPEGSKSRAKAEDEGLRVVTPAEASRRGRPDHGAGAGPGAAQALRRVDRAEPEGRRRALLRPRLQHPLRLHQAAGATSTSRWSRRRARATWCAASSSTARACPCWSRSSRTPPARRFELALSYAKAIGGTRAGAIKTTFTEETETDLFGEQAVLCGGASQLVKYGFEVLTEAGYAPEIAYFECLHELKLIVDLMYEGGIAKQRWSVSDTAEYGDYVSGPRVIDPHVKENMQAVLRDIQDGTFAARFIADQDAGAPGVQGAAGQGRAAPDRGGRAQAARPDELGCHRRRLHRGHRRPLTPRRRYRLAAMKLAVIPGDGIGIEVTEQALRVLDAVLPGVEPTQYDLGAARWHRTGEVLPDSRARGDPRPRRDPARRGRRPVRAVRRARARAAAAAALRTRPPREPAPGQAVSRGGDAAGRRARRSTSSSSARAPRARTPATAACCARARRTRVATEVSVNTAFGVERVVRDAFERAQSARAST